MSLSERRRHAFLGLSKQKRDRNVDVNMESAYPGEFHRLKRRKRMESKVDLIVREYDSESMPNSFMRHC